MIMSLPPMRLISASSSCALSAIECYAAILFPETQYTLEYILAVFNSKVLNYWYAKSFHRVDINLETIRTLPIKRISFSTSAKRRSELIGQAKKIVNQQDVSEILSFVDGCTNAVPEESVGIHDLLAYLTQQMLDLNKQKQGEMTRFLTWLEGVLKVSVDEVTGKSKLRNYIGDYQKDESEVSFEEVEEILYKNRGKLGISTSDARPMAKIRDEYEKSLAVLRPLKERLRWTDGVIDQVVYRLYGLTEEEIKIVEGRA